VIRSRGSAAALIGSAHFGPTVVVTTITLALSLSSGAGPLRAAVLTLAMFLGQLSVGWSNDWLDADRDRAAGRLDKPAATGSIDAGALRVAALVALVPALALPFTVSPPAALLHVLFVASAWSYNLGLKATPASVLPYLVSFGILPALATLLRQPPTWPPVWATVVGAALGVAAHFANVVPDVAADRAAGNRGLPQLLGARGSAVVAAIVVLTAAIVVATAARPGPVGVVAVALALVAAAVGLIRGLAARPGRVPFRAVMGAALLLVVALLAAGQTL
jgi:4-hydroxybenzoate polyprenyltransferase